MCGGSNGKGESSLFTVRVTNQEVIAAVLPVQEHWLPFSNLDLLLPPIDVSVFFCYNNTNRMSFGSMLRSLKNALGQALVSYYAFAGEVVHINSMGEPELLCNNRGVDFVEVEADLHLQNLNFYNPDESIQGKLVPIKKHGVLAIQFCYKNTSLSATYLKCGGIMVACTFDHRIADAYSANMFLVSWAQISRPIKPATLAPPCFRRSLLNPRRPLCIHPSLDDMYVPISISPPPFEPEPDNSDSLISRIYYITADQLCRMQSLASSSSSLDHIKNRTKLESFSAFLWKMVAMAAASSSSTTTLTGDCGKRFVVKMGVVVDGRKRLSNCDQSKEATMNSYFGNVLSVPFGGKPVEDLVEKPLSWAAEEVHKFLDTAVTEEHFLELIDLVEEHRPTSALARIYSGNTADVGPALVVSSGQRFSQSKIDFGWGKPMFGSYHFPWGDDTGYVMPMLSPKRNGDWVVYMHLLKGHIDFIKSKAAHVFKPLTWDYLNTQHY
ncbi:hypothetical protein PIB30_067279 [Stylosanthes scabra]|uniref:Uncharacterized protein n=1 Tax=Stylosanthes scabra TaxID=79078 RepID=A0ABU6ZL96_9FABA|nr:hypothetical protein [Stylosanthes scabra]